MLELVQNAQTEVFPEFCPSCFILIKGDSFPGGPDCNIHTHPACVANWYRKSEQERRERACEAKRIARSEWADRPSSEGPHWARIPECGMLRNFLLVRRLGELMVTSGEKFVPLSRFDHYEFLPKAA